jgi:predicted nucleotidyltransferase
MENINSILSEFKKELSCRYGSRMRRLVCYGSQARREAGPESDVDLVLILEGDVRPSHEIDQVVDLLADFNLRYEVLISLLPVGQDMWNTAEGPFWRNVHREGREI